MAVIIKGIAHTRIHVECMMCHKVDERVIHAQRLWDYGAGQEYVQNAFPECDDTTRSVIKNWYTPKPMRAHICDTCDVSHDEEWNDPTFGKQNYPKPKGRTLEDLGGYLI